jgi:hypothetical protein
LPSFAGYRTKSSSSHNASWNWLTNIALFSETADPNPTASFLSQSITIDSGAFTRVFGGQPIDPS